MANLSRRTWGTQILVCLAMNLSGVKTGHKTLESLSTPHVREVTDGNRKSLWQQFRTIAFFNIDWSQNAFEVVVKMRVSSVSFFDVRSQISISRLQNCITLKAGFHMIATIAAIAEKSAQPSQRSNGNTTGTSAIAGTELGVYLCDRSDRER